MKGLGDVSLTGNQPTVTPPFLPVVDRQSFAHRPSLLAGAFEGNAVFRKFWWFQSWMAMHRRKGANLRHR